jgi:hypothetical protein
MSESTKKALNAEYHQLTEREREILFELTTYIEISRATENKNEGAGNHQSIRSKKVSLAAIRVLAKLVPVPPHSAPHTHESEEDLSRAEQEYSEALALCLETNDDPFIQVNRILMYDEEMSSRGK